MDGNPTIIGYAHHFQLVAETLPRHPWDVPLDVLVTEQETRRSTGDERSFPPAEPGGSDPTTASGV